MRRVFAFCFLLLPGALLFFSFPIQAGVAERLDRLDQDLSAIEKQSEEILQHQDEVLTKIDTLKIRVRRT